MGSHAGPRISTPNLIYTFSPGNYNLGKAAYSWDTFNSPDVKNSIVNNKSVPTVITNATSSADLTSSRSVFTFTGFTPTTNDFTISFFVKPIDFPGSIPTKVGRTLPRRRKRVRFARMNFNSYFYLYVGMVAPFYLINNVATYKKVYEPFSFCVDMGTSNLTGWPGAGTGYGTRRSQGLMTDYKFSLNKTYLISLCFKNCDTTRPSFQLYINDAQEQFMYTPCTTGVSGNHMLIIGQNWKNRLLRGDRNGVTMPGAPGWINANNGTVMTNRIVTELVLPELHNTPLKGRALTEVRMGAIIDAAIKSEQLRDCVTNIQFGPLYIYNVVDSDIIKNIYNHNFVV